MPFQDSSQLRSFDKECDTDDECADSPYGLVCTMRLCSRFTTCESDADCEVDQGCNLEFGACALLAPMGE